MSIQSLLDRIQDSGMRKQAAAYASLSPRQRLLYRAAINDDVRFGDKLLKMAADAVYYTQAPKGASNAGLDRLFRMHANKIMREGSTKVPILTSKPDRPGSPFGRPQPPQPLPATTQVSDFERLGKYVHDLKDAHLTRGKLIGAALASKDTFNRLLNRGDAVDNGSQLNQLYQQGKDFLSKANDVNEALRPNFKMPEIKI